MRYDFLNDSHETERIKVISAWSMFRDDDLPVRPNPTDTRARSLHEHMVNQCVSEDIWFRTMLDIDVGAPPLPQEEVRLEFMRRYEEDSGKRLAVLRNKDDIWWENDIVGRVSGPRPGTNPMDRLQIAFNSDRLSSTVRILSSGSKPLCAIECVL